ncbi:MAG TPA: tetratricopeptide repeat protein [Pyrinomonadaceae bacterium]|jgi:serine/threonine protein kinase/Tfp pilus assembly protein PilF
MLPRDTLLDDRYRIIELLGTGAMGSVYLSLDERLSCNVAVKGTIIKQFRLDPEKEAELRRAFEREAKLLANLQHEAIPRVVDYFTFEDEQYLVMEYIPGKDLFEQAEKMRRKDEHFDVVKVSDWALQLLDALVYLHTQPEPVIHKDIKLSNIKINERNRVKLLDFGISKGYAGEMTKVDAGSLQMGTEEYSPLEQFLKFPSRAAITLRQALSIKHADKVEQVLSQNTDARSDLYSLAVTIYRLLTGKPPADYLPRALAVWEGEPDPLVPVHEINPEVPVPVSNVLMHALALDKENRPWCAEAMREEFQAAWQEHYRSTEVTKREEIAAEERTEFERLLAEERQRREEAEIAREEKERELAAINSRLQEITASMQSAPPQATAASSSPERRSILRFPGRKYAWFFLMFTVVAGVILFWQAREETAKAREFEQHFSRGKALLDEKSYDAAINEYTDAIGINPKSSDSFANRGEAFRKKQELTRALQDYNEAIRLNKQNLFALVNRADVYCQSNDFDRAFADFGEVQKQKPDYDFLYEKRGACYETRGMYDEAVADYSKALTLDPDETWTYFKRGLVYFLTDKDEKAVADYTEVLRRTPNDYAAYANRGAAYQRLGKKNLAAADFQKSEELKEVSEIKK